ncbi:transcriptional regulator, LacI family [Austwickia chelonae]|uniref:Putative LacI family transcriptional regulator n=1 Tax=Austwickia chelonae NBRC 105200 TaxID=1184607 RepID=K6VJR4_9MICO|nr:LacI family DNA-binding transcriptional regulator [Austwickia chelonae]GAB76964.1 putative LacI family transcriptional regulator [Austwickia chelonae NBRC 105200]SEW32790.1 transcriptional regulator, LacI family [Austwickia chelonae]
MGRVTINDVARRAGVSKSSASFALNGRPGVSEKTRARVLAAAAELHWQPHSAARALSHARADMVGLVFSRPARTLGAEPFFGQFVSGLQDGLREGSMGLQLAVVDGHDAEIEVYRRWWQAQRVDGVVLVDVHDGDGRMSAVRELGLPSVVVGADPGECPGMAVISADDEGTMARIMDYLAAIGHRRIALVAGERALRHTRRRMSAVEQAGVRLGLERVESVPTDYSDVQGADATRELLSRHGDRPTAIVYDSDLLAVAGLGVAHEMGVSVPSELSLVSFEDSVLARSIHPAMTAMHRDVFALGQLAARTLCEGLAGSGEPPTVMAERPQLVVRESTSSPNILQLSEPVLQ